MATPSCSASNRSRIVSVRSWVRSRSENEHLSGPVCDDHSNDAQRRSEAADPQWCAGQSTWTLKRRLVHSRTPRHLKIGACGNDVALERTRSNARELAIERVRVDEPVAAPA